MSLNYEPSVGLRALARVVHPHLAAECTIQGAWGAEGRQYTGLVFKAHRLLHNSTLGLRVIKKKKYTGTR